MALATEVLLLIATTFFGEMTMSRAEIMPIDEISADNVSMLAPSMGNYTLQTQGDRCYDHASYCFRPGTTCSCCLKSGEKGKAYDHSDKEVCIVYGTDEKTPSIGPPGMCFSTSETPLCQQPGSLCYCCRRPPALIKEYSTAFCFATGNFDATVSSESAVVQNQGSCGSCWSFATTAQLAARAIKVGTGIGGTLPEWGSLLSPEVPVAFYGSYSADLNGCSGGSLMDACRVYQEHGVPELGCARYFSGSCSESSTDSTRGCLAGTGYQEGTCYSDTGRAWHTWGKYRTDIIADVRYVPGVEQMMSDLVDNGPLTTQFDVYESFFRYRDGVIDSVSGSNVGAHAVLIVGFGDDEGSGSPYWRARNSWSEDWGESGYFRILRGSNLADFESYPVSMLMEGFAAAATPTSVSNVPKAGGWTELAADSDSVRMALEELYSHLNATRTNVNPVLFEKAFSQVVNGLHVELHFTVGHEKMIALTRSLARRNMLSWPEHAFTIVHIRSASAGVILI